MKFIVDSGKMIVKARSKVHDTTATWSKLRGNVDADPVALDGATATIEVDMTAYDAGDFIKNRKLRTDYALDANPRAVFVLTDVTDIVRDGTAFTAKARGRLIWRGKEVVIDVAGRGTIDAQCVTATATFELDIRRLGMTAPKVLMFKVDDVVSIDVSLQASSVPS